MGQFPPSLLVCQSLLPSGMQSQAFKAQPFWHLMNTLRFKTLTQPFLSLPFHLGLLGSTPGPLPYPHSHATPFQPGLTHLLSPALAT